ncbi:MAG TPA: class I SAM-dependent methyltransferase [Conexibacter sp.]|nr:class I SAM-dependent methyltransferase [Conexibacter sp.]
MTIDTAPVTQRPSQTSGPPHCPLCGGTTTPFRAWAWRCDSCDVRFSSLEPRIETGAAVLLNEDKRAVGLRAVRDRSHAIVLDAIAARRSLAGLAVLDVGSGHGWFLEAAAARGFDAVGIEPDRDVAERTRGRGLNVLDGYFPDDLPTADRFDVIAFNDVFEHLPDPVAALQAVHERLRPGGILAISIPTADGLGYRVATTLARVGIAAPLDRLWQRDLPSPHLWYFTESSLTGLVLDNGFTPLDRGRLPSVERAGLRERIAVDPRPGVVNKLAFVGVSLAAPLLNHARFSDAMWLSFERAGDA